MSAVRDEASSATQGRPEAARRRARLVRVGSLAIGGGAPIAIQSMTKTQTSDVAATVQQVRALATAGCEIVRVAVPDDAAAKALREIRREADQVPLVADIHFHWQYALAAIEAGFDKIRWNPGNIRREAEINRVVDAARERNVPIRVGVNVGSLDPECERAHPDDLAEAIVQSALRSVRRLEARRCTQIVVSLKSSDVRHMVRAYRRMAQICEYPLHLGVTEAGLPDAAVVKSAIGIGALLVDGIGDTLRVSITGDPMEEVEVARRILASLQLRAFVTNVVACPSCGRCEVDVLAITHQVEERLRRLAARAPRCRELTVAVMGCVVNGPGESAHADVGLAGGSGMGVIYRRGRVVRRVAEADLVEALMAEVEDLASARPADVAVR